MKTTLGQSVIPTAGPYTGKIGRVMTEPDAKGLVVVEFDYGEQLNKHQEHVASFGTFDPRWLKPAGRIN